MNKSNIQVKITTDEPEPHVTVKSELLLLKLDKRTGYCSKCGEELHDWGGANVYMACCKCNHNFGFIEELPWGNDVYEVKVTLWRRIKSFFLIGRWR